MLPDDVHDAVDALLAPVDAALKQRYPGERRGRQPVHVIYVPADRFVTGLATEYGVQALAAVDRYGPLPFDDEIAVRVRDKLAAEPVEDLRIDFEDGYGLRPDAEEDAAAIAAATALREDPQPPAGFGVRCKS